jgi:hypothetical protein
MNLLKIIVALCVSAVLHSSAHAEENVITIIPKISSLNNPIGVEINFGGTWEKEFGTKKLFIGDSEWYYWNSLSDTFNSLMLLKQPKNDGQLYNEILSYASNYTMPIGPKLEFFKFFIWKKATLFLAAHNYHFQN